MGSNLRSKQIDDYFPVEITQLIPGHEFLFDVHFYFPQNRHLIIWRPKGENPDAELLARYQSKGVKTLWIHNEDKDAFAQYLKNTGQEAPAPEPEKPEPPKVAEAPEPAPPPPAPKTQEGALLANAINSEAIPEEAKKAIVSAAAQNMVSESVRAETLLDQNQVNQKAKEIIQDVLFSTSGKTRSIAEEIWRMSNVDPDLQHAVNVATYAVIFAMAFGHVDPEMISDLALAGLLHDVGLSQISATHTAEPMKMMGLEAQTTYAKHVDFSLALIDQYGDDIPPRAINMIKQHHEKFDGSGYPVGLKGFKLDDIAQLVAMADLLDALATGQWDGTERNMKNSFEMIEKMDEDRSFPEFFNPEIFSVVLKWTKTKADQSLFENAAQAVGQKTMDIV